MSRRDTYHDAVKRALIKDGWTISHDPLRLSYEGTTVSTDLGAEKAFADGERIAVEIIAVEVKDFDGDQKMSQFEKALGQYNLYRTLLRVLSPGRTIFWPSRKMSLKNSSNFRSFSLLPTKIRSNS
ncbi:MAG: element excision factor XisH family protein [Acidobacteriota bacterium]|nr:element excision factor XisH family protein [Acidobacteriota bacterium]